MGHWLWVGMAFLSVAMADHTDKRSRSRFGALTPLERYQKILKHYTFELRSGSKELLDRYIAGREFQSLVDDFREKVRTEGILSLDAALWNDLTRDLNISGREANLMVADLWLQSLPVEDRARVLQFPPSKTESGIQETYLRVQLGDLIRMMSARNPKQYSFEEVLRGFREIMLRSGRTDAAGLASDPLWTFFKTAMEQRGEGPKAEAIQSKVVYWRNLGADFMASSEYYFAFGGPPTPEDDRDLEWRLLKARGQKPMPDYKAYVDHGAWKVTEEPKPVVVRQPVAETIYDRGIPSNLLVPSQTYNVRSPDGKIHRWTLLGYNANGPVWSYGGCYGGSVCR